MKVYIIGADKETDLAHIRKIGNIPEATELILVDSAESIPLEDRFMSDGRIQEIHKLILPPKTPDLIVYADDKRKGHQRPYKFHK